MLPGRGYSIIYRAITGNCTLQQFVDSYCTVSNKENMDCGSQDILKRRGKKKSPANPVVFLTMFFSEAPQVPVSELSLSYIQQNT